MEPNTKVPKELRESFDDLQLLGRGGQGLTFKAIRKLDQKKVVLKVLDFVELSSWKNYDLFLREIATLKTLDHHAIPKVLGVYPETAEDAEPKAVVLIQEYFEGNSLQDLLDASEEPWSVEEVRSLMEEILDILSYLHALNPPVVHRDIKPSNIIRRLDGSYALIDFGAATATQKTNASTFVGTNGYMAPEQMMGRAEPRSDIYSLGATALHLSTGIHPVDLTREDFSFRLDGLGLAPGFARLVARLVHPLPEKRFRDAQQVRQSLHQSNALVLAEVNEKGFKLVRQDDGTRIDIPRPPRLQKWVIWVFLSMVSPIPILAIFVVAEMDRIWGQVFFAVMGVMGAYMTLVAVFLLFRNRHFLIDDTSIHYVERLGPYSRKRTRTLAEAPDMVLQEIALRPHGLGMLALSEEQRGWLSERLPKEMEDYQ